MSIETEFTGRLRARIDEEDEKAKSIVTGFRLRSFDEYRFSAGYCQALNDVRTIMDEILADLQKE